MAKSIQLSKSSTVYVPDISSIKLVVTAINAENMPSKIFVKQRIRNFAQDRIDDTFVAVCTPTQLEDFEEDCPAPGSSYYRTDRIELVGRTAEMVQSVFDSLLYEVKKLVVDLTDLDDLLPEIVYSINAEDLLTTVNGPAVDGRLYRNGQPVGSYNVDWFDISCLSGFPRTRVKLYYTGLTVGSHVWCEVYTDGLNGGENRYDTWYGVYSKLSGNYFVLDGSRYQVYSSNTNAGGVGIIQAISSCPVVP